MRTRFYRRALRDCFHDLFIQLQPRYSSQKDVPSVFTVVHHETLRDASLSSRLESRASGIDCRRVNLKSPLITYFIISLSNYTTESFSFRDGAKFGARARARDAFGKLLRESSPLRSVIFTLFVAATSREKEGEKTRAKQRVRECKKGQERERESCCFINPICNTLNL